MVGSLAPELTAGAVAALLILAAGAVAALLAWRAVHRRWRRVRNHAITTTALALWGAASSADARHLFSGDWAGLSALRTSRRMWRSVELAERGVRHVEEVGGPTGDLPAICRRLRAVASDLDRAVRIESAAGGLSERLRAQVADVEAAGRDVQLAAAGAIGDLSGPRAREVAADARQEARALTAGLARMRQLVD